MQHGERILGKTGVTLFSSVPSSTLILDGFAVGRQPKYHMFPGMTYHAAGWTVISDLSEDACQTKCTAFGKWINV